ncbi:cell surface glycoprotein CD200 receptor 1-B-like isoform X2 [Acipenser ruthenus]|uniref:cell surface glycoprotein CD200 receptor 1-B-like isoform X2 n=1 Tax=Acipenser ruthenus TaxID=7906 RepID=UPI00145BED06|nr:cell surface glycoprotein CD200 receptor 1-B-like isoform X2 [Acipenser ruthenus]
MSVTSISILTVLSVLTISAEDIQMVTTELGKDVSLHCTNRTWSEIMFETWKIRKTNGAECQIAFRFDRTDANSTCEDRITIQNTSENRPFLHVSHINNADEGNYTCQSTYNGGMDIVQFNVSFIEYGIEPPAESDSGLVTILSAILAFLIMILITSFFFKRILLAALRSCCKSAIPATMPSNKHQLPTWLRKSKGSVGVL